MLNVATATPPPTVSVSGTVLFGGSPLSGVTVTFSDRGSTTTNYYGYYGLDVPYGWTGTVTPSLSG